MIGEIETGKKYPSLETLDKIASAFGIQTYKLIYDSENAEEEDRNREETKQKLIVTDNDQYLAMRFSKMSNDFETMAFMAK